MDHKDKKFKLKSELEVYKRLQKDGKATTRMLAKKTGTSTTAVKSILKRMQRRNFYKVGAIPKLDMFSEIPIAFIGFPKVNPARLKKLKANFDGRYQLLGLICNESEVLLILTESDRSKLTELIFEVMQLLQAQPSLHILTPCIEKFNLAIPETVLDQIYKRLPDKRKK